MPLKLKTIKISIHVLQNYVFDITSIVKISIEIHVQDSKVWENGQISSTCRIPAIHVFM